MLSDGRIIHTGGPGRHFKKSSAGYNLTELMARIIIPESNNAIKHAFVNVRYFIFLVRKLCEQAINSSICNFIIKHNQSIIKS